MNSKEIKEERAAIVKQMQDMANQIKEEDRNFNADELEKYDTLDSKQNELREKAESEERIEKVSGLIQPEIEEKRIRHQEVVTDRDRELAVRAWICRASGNDSMIKDRWLDAAQRCAVNMNDRALHMGIEERAQTVGTANQGGYLTSTDKFVGLDQATLAYGGMLQSCRILRTSNGNQIHFATNDDTANSAAIVGENTEVSNTSVTFGTKVLDAYKYVTNVFPVSVELIEDSEFPIIPFIQEALATRLGRKWNYDLTLGTGSDQPQGVVPVATVGKTAGSATTLAADELIDLLHSVDASYRNGAVWMMNDSTYAATRKLTDDNGQFLWGAGLNAGGRDVLLGHPIVVNNDLADIASEAKPILFGNFDKYVARIVNSVQVIVARERYIDTLSVGFFGYGRMDAELLNTAAIKSMQMAE